MAAAGFTRDRLYIEYAVAYDPELWALHSPAGAALEEPGLLKVRPGALARLADNPAPLRWEPLRAAACL
jgi:hypothetical protein